MIHKTHRLARILRKALPLSLGVGCLFLLTAHPALATTFTGSGGGFSTFGNLLGDVGNFMVGPLAKFVGALAIVGGVITYVRGGELNQSMHIFGGVAIGIGALIITANLMSTIGTGLII